MRRLLLIILFFIGLFWAVSTYGGGLATQGEFNSLILDFREVEDVAQVESRVQALSQQFNVELSLNSEFSEADNVYIVSGNANLLEDLQASEFAKYTEFIEPNYVYSTLFKPNDPDFDKQWNMHSINIEAAWLRSKGKGITVAVIDTGVSQVPDLRQTAFVPGYDFVNDQQNANDDNGHGTHVAGTIAQSTNNRYGVTGIAYEAKIMPLKVLSAAGFGTVADIAEAVRFAADHGADVINMSLGGGGASKLFQEAIDYAHGKGVVVIAAAGNENRNSVSYPARYTHVVGVSAFDAEGGKAFYSNYGAGVDIAAPGGSTQKGQEGGILQETIDRRNPGQSVFRYLQGTSMAAPHVAGVAASLKAIGVKDPDKVTEILLKSAQRVKDDPRNYFGAGKLDAAAALKQADGRLPWWPWPIFGEGFLGKRLWLDIDVLGRYEKFLYLLAAIVLTWLLWLTRNFRWNGWFLAGLILGSTGVFILKDLYIVDLPQWPLRLLGSSIPELGFVLLNSTKLNPIFASALIPFILVSALLSIRNFKWLAIGSTIGVAAVLGVNAVLNPTLAWLGSGIIARVYLGINTVLCFGLAHLAVQSAVESDEAGQ